MFHIDKENMFKYNGKVFTSISCAVVLSMRQENSFFHRMSTVYSVYIILRCIVLSSESYINIVTINTGGNACLVKHLRLLIIKCYQLYQATDASKHTITLTLSV